MHRKGHSMYARHDPGAHGRATRTHERAADLHDRAARLQAEHAIEMGQMGRPESKERAERLAQKERSMAAYERRLAVEHRRDADNLALDLD